MDAIQRSDEGRPAAFAGRAQPGSSHCGHCAAHRHSRPRPGLLAMAFALAAMTLALLSPPAGAQAQEPPKAPATLAPALAAQGPAPAPAPAPAQTPPAIPPQQADVYLNQRLLITLKAHLLERSPADRAAVAQGLLAQAIERGETEPVTLWSGPQGLRAVEVGGRPVFYLASADLAGLAADEAAAAERVRLRVQQALAEAQEARDPRRVGEAMARVVGTGLLAAAGVWAVLAARRRGDILLRLRSMQAQQASGDPGRLRHPSAAASGGVSLWLPQLRTVLSWLLALVAWGAVLVTVDLWITYGLKQFAYTRPWGEASEQWLLQTLRRFVLAIADAVPGLVTAALIFIGARLLTRALGALLRRVEQGGPTLGWIDADTAGPTRRVGAIVVWLFALALAYPFLPGSSSEAFKGVSVLAGLMFSFGASGVVGQVVSGLSLMYSRALRPGEYVRIGQTEGTVAMVGMFATRLHTGMGEEVVLPNAWVAGQSVHNFSRLVAGGAYMLQAGVTIGYATPWRQVHALLLEAARRTPGVAAQPDPFVVQTALSDFYVEYRLCAHGALNAPRRRAEALSALHANIQDVFNENGVQIMSPHYRSDPAQPQVVAPEDWAPPLRARFEADSR